MSVKILKKFIPENAGPISIKFHTQLQGKSGGGGGGGILFKCPGHMTKRMPSLYME